MKNLEELERPFFDDVEALFSEFVEFFGGTVIDKLESNLTDRLNADYLFSKQNTVAELKTFKKDIFSKDDDLPRIEELIVKWVSKNMMSQKEYLSYRAKKTGLPEKCLTDLIGIASRTIERAIHKANKQIEESIKTLNIPNANGIIFLINDGNYFFTTEGFLKVVSNIISRKYKESFFNVIVYITVNQTTRKHGSDLDYCVGIPIYTKVDDYGETIVSEEFHQFINELGKKFQVDFLNYKTGQQLKDHIKIQDLAEAVKELENHKFVPKKIIYKK